ncbi:MAG: SseB family protein [Actinomycetaceae bacterium]|nr:SseB family protein [Actinomycetaceae bacterium]
MAEPTKFLADNPFAGDLGELKPELAAAFEAPADQRVEAIVAALGRVIIPVLPHAHPGAEKDPDGCPDSDLLQVDFPGGRQATPVFSSAEALATWNPNARPVPMAIQQVAVAALKTGTGLITLDHDQDTCTWLGRTAVIALAVEGPWRAPWADLEIPRRISEKIGGELAGFHGVAIKPGQRGESIVEIAINPGASDAEMMNIVQTVAAVIGSEEYVRARLDLVELRPVPASNV